MDQVGQKLQLMVYELILGNRLNILLGYGQSLIAELANLRSFCCVVYFLQIVLGLPWAYRK